MAIRQLQTDRELDDELENQMEALEEKSRLQRRLKTVREEYSKACVKLHTACNGAEKSLTKLMSELITKAEDLEDKINNLGV